MENTAKNFALQLGSLITLYASVSGLIVLLFGIITIQYPDVAAQGYWEYESASSSIRFSIALLIVAFPAYVILTRLVNSIRRKEDGTYLKLTKWLIYLSLLVGGALLLGDLVMVINTFLNGDLTVRFILKALAFLVVVGSAFTYYVFDARGYWQAHEDHSILYAAGMSLFVLVALVLGFLRIETPAEVREVRIDSQQITDLSMIQSRVYEYYQVNNELPDTLEAAYAGLEIPVASTGRDAYTYAPTGVESFKLCAEFANESSLGDQKQYINTYYMEGGIRNPDNWDHKAGNWCFERVIDTAVPNPAFIK